MVAGRSVSCCSTCGCGRLGRTSSADQNLETANKWSASVVRMKLRAAAIAASELAAVNVRQEQHGGLVRSAIANRSYPTVSESKQFRNSPAMPSHICCGVRPRRRAASCTFRPCSSVPVSRKVSLTRKTRRRAEAEGRCRPRRSRAFLACGATEPSRRQERQCERGPDAVVRSRRIWVW